MMLGSTPKANDVSNRRLSGVDWPAGIPNTKSAPLSTKPNMAVRISPILANTIRPGSVRSVKKAKVNCNANPPAITRH